MGLGAPLLDPPPSAPPLYPQIPPGGAGGGYLPPPATGVPVAPQQHHLPPPLPPAYHQHQQQQQQQQLPPPVLVISDAPLLTRVALAPGPHTCPACGACGPTKVKRESGCCAWGLALGMCFVCAPCFWVPFCLDCDRDLVHRCSACGAEVARVRPI